MTILENIDIDIDKAALENIDIDKDTFENIDIDINEDILENIDIIWTVPQTYRNPHAWK